ncbi:hypothetical protein [Puia dinghuensis]|uniref:Uncharacterized protein n=1 Tax=Puia dinghuensis TaxID=1792502 RepID=A0A8J2XUV6_9BACT|nr:hypothetical protein [Puia dinghuensis]GGB14517.1 hypothetical protein GCM10011511_42950 [Puia dinghuensis]
MTAQELFSEFHGKLVAITKTDDETLIGIVMLAAGLEKAGTLVPQTSFLEVDVIGDIVAYKKYPTNYKFKHRLIHEGDIEDIRLYDLSGKPVYLDYSAFQDLTSGQNPTAVWEVIREINANKFYIVTQERVQYKLVLGKDGELKLEILQ